MYWVGAMVILRLPAFVSDCRVVARVGVTTAVEGLWVWLGVARRVWSAGEVCEAGVETGVEGSAYGTGSAVEEAKIEVLEVLLNLEDEVAGRGRVVVAVVKAVALKVLSSGNL